MVSTRIHGSLRALLTLLLPSLAAASAGSSLRSFSRVAPSAIARRPLVFRQEATGSLTKVAPRRSSKNIFQRIGARDTRCNSHLGGRRVVFAEGMNSTESAPSPVAPPTLETRKIPISAQIPFGFYLLGSGLVSIAAIGSFYEIAAKNPVFGVIPYGNPLWLPILAFFGITGLPSATWMFIQGVNGFNEWQAALDRMDGYDRRD
eukprot:CAMPEP_0167778366 /NCGR_PEP_ID=MMETSP0111_2-20121227/4213_1 /TAXON_ID=91324 /ORGANISM="Lotharella globosa, Strain CCCM811" /LENGTH=203 /DNA_ID=CAMNT_0007668661 /DNA_START=21 /DNA_END=632 /DNA_ORIENTATION=+